MKKLHKKGGISRDNSTSGTKMKV